MLVPKRVHQLLDIPCYMHQAPETFDCKPSAQCLRLHLPENLNYERKFRRFHYFPLDTEPALNRYHFRGIFSQLFYYRKLLRYIDKHGLELWQNQFRAVVGATINF